MRVARIPAPDIEPARTSASRQAVARSVEEIATELLMITEVKVGLRKRGLISVREGFLDRRGGEEDGRFPDPQVSTKGTDKAKVEALSFAHLRKFCKKF